MSQSQNATYVRFPKFRQRGGGASDWMHSQNAVYIQPGPMTKMTRKYIDDSPMFHPLEPGRQFATPWATGIYPVGIYYMNQVAQKHCSQMPGCTQPGSAQRTLTNNEKLQRELKQAML